MELSPQLGVDERLEDGRRLRHQSERLELEVIADTELGLQKEAAEEHAGPTSARTAGARVWLASASLTASFCNGFQALG
jgi:hypothetical protein